MNKTKLVLVERVVFYIIDKLVEFLKNKYGHTDKTETFGLVSKTLCKK